MSEPTTAPDAPKSNEAMKPEEAPRSPFAGCLILIVMGLVVLILIGAAGYSVKKQTDAYKEFTATEAVPAPIADLTAHEVELNSLMNRLRHFSHELKNDRPAEITLTALEINLAIAQFKPLEEYRGFLHVNKITSSEIQGDFHKPLRSTGELPNFVRSVLKIEERENHINGTFTGTPFLSDGKLILKLTEVVSTMGEIPQPVFDHISRVPISGQLDADFKEKPDQEPEALTALKKLTSLTLNEDQLTLAYSPTEKPPSIEEESNALAQKATQLVALGAIIFILTMILLFIIMNRRNKAKRNAASS